jgi:hypothetical protein
MMPGSVVSEPTKKAAARTMEGEGVSQPANDIAGNISRTPDVSTR